VRIRNNFYYIFIHTNRKTIINIYKEDENLSIINEKIQIINNILTNLSYNVNMELILDKFVIEMRGLHE